MTDSSLDEPSINSNSQNRHVKCYDIFLRNCRTEDSLQDKGATTFSGRLIVMSTNPQAKILHAGEGKRIAVMGDMYTFLAEGEDTSKSYAIWEAVVPPGGGPPSHVQSREDEGFYVLEGEMTFVADSRKVVGRKGSFLNIPRGVVHTFKNEGQADARMLIMVAPAGMEKMFEEMGTVVTDPTTEPSPPTPKEMEKAGAVAPKYGIEIRPNG
jgi:quercetin dioxygenase-like cupin family protein